MTAPEVQLDGSIGEGGGQILRTALSLALVTGRPFRIEQIRANRPTPGLRPQHLKAVEAAAALGGEVRGAAVGSRALSFRPLAFEFEPSDLRIDIGTAGATSLVLQALHLPIALRADRPVRLTLTGGTFNEHAPSFPFLESTWRGLLASLGMPLALSMPSAGFFPRGGGQLDAQIEPARPRPLILEERGPLRRITGMAGVCRLDRKIADRLRARAEARLAARGLDARIDLADWPGLGPGTAISLSAEHDGIPTTVVGLGARGKPAEAVADEAVAELLAFLDAPGAVDAHSADQLLLPLALAEGRSSYTVAAVTEHLRTNVATIRAFLDREIRVEEPDGARPGRVTVE